MNLKRSLLLAVLATAEQCAAWTDDAAFAAVLAVNAGFELPTE